MLLLEVRRGGFVHRHQRGGRWNTHRIFVLGIRLWWGSRKDTCLIFLATKQELKVGTMVHAGIVFTGGFLLAVVSSSFVIMPTFASSSSSSAIVVDGTIHTAVAAAASSTSSGTSSLPTTAQIVRWIDDAGNALTEETPDQARVALQSYLYDNIMPYDIPIARTLGFPSPPADALTIISQRIARAVAFDSSAVVDPVTPAKTNKVDGLSDGILNSTLYYSLQAKALYPWTDLIPKSIYMEYVVPYAIVNEPRVDHRPLLFDKLHDPLSKYIRSPTDDATKTKDAQISDMKNAVKIINTRLWSLLGKRDRGGHSQPIVFVAGQTPRIYDPLSVVAYGHSSCTGLAVLLIAALRAVGIPCRMAGTPAWHGKVDDGNHSWVEVYVPSNDDKGKGQWMFLEPSPGIKEAVTETADADDLDRDPKKRWFCTPDHFDGKTKVYATKFAKGDDSQHYPMAWSDPEIDVGVPGEDRTAYYMSVCGAPPTAAAPKPN